MVYCSFTSQKVQCLERSEMGKVTKHVLRTWHENAILYLAWRCIVMRRSNCVCWIQFLWVLICYDMQKLYKSSSPDRRQTVPCSTYLNTKSAAWTWNLAKAPLSGGVAKKNRSGHMLYRPALQNSQVRHVMWGSMATLSPIKWQYYQFINFKIQFVQWYTLLVGVIGLSLCGRYVVFSGYSCFLHQ